MTACGIVAVARWAGLSLSVTFGLLGFTQTAISKVSSEQSKKENI